MKPFEHQVYHRNMNPCLAGFRQFFVVFAESTTPAQPGQGALHHHPPAGQHLKPMAVPIPAHHAQHPTTGGPSPRHQPPSLGGISPDDLEPGEPVQQLDQHQLGPIPVLDVGGMNCYGQEQSGGIHYNVALAPRYLLPRVVAPRPLSMAEVCWATGVSKASINVRLSVQHKCHSVMPPLYQTLTQ